LALQGELDSLAGPTAELLRAAAVAGDPFELELAAAAAGLDDETALVPLDDLVQRDLVRATPVPRRFRFRHPLVRHAVYESASPSFRIVAHGRVAAALEAAGAGAGARAGHVAASACPGDRQAAALLAEAGIAAGARAPAVAAHWLEEALRLLPGGDPAWRLGLLAARARALVSAGHLQQGLEALGEALALAPVEATELRVGLTCACATVENMLGRHAEAGARLRAALDALPGTDSVEDSVQAGALHVALASTMGMWLNHPDELLTHARRGLAAAGRADDDALAATARALLAVGEVGFGRRDAAATLVTQAGALLDGCDDATIAGRIEAPLFLGWAAGYVGCFADALRWFERGIAVSRQSGQDHVLVALMYGQTLALALLGRLAPADEVASAAVEAARLSANTQGVALALWQRCLVSLLAGELPEALRAGEECAALLRTLEPGVVGAMAGWVVGQALVEAGEPVRATAVMLELEGGEDLPHNNPPGRCIAYEILTRAALAAGRPDQAAGWAARAEASASGLGDGLFAGFARRARAVVLLEQGDAAAAAQAALEAAAGAQRSGARIEAARARLLAGRALALAGERENAIEQLERAEADLSACGARRLRDEAASELRALGKRVARPAGTRPSVADAVDRLSPREHEVAELVATGQANKQIAATLHLSVNTVESHLKRIFAKLEVRNRAAVAAALVRRGDAARPR
jgi:DNA-binding NarL/FixJ family response regulator